MIDRNWLGGLGLVFLSGAFMVALVLAVLPLWVIQVTFKVVLLVGTTALLAVLLVRLER